ncbi:hypothetical protein ACSV5M_04850 [Cellvibrio sp. ARAG 10.3]|uniref:hypothetical protein n=1 Tax=Cellvibrio sp. ARAG 10.3 TaxID=3451358 RepID=UPI003F47245D
MMKEAIEVVKFRLAAGVTQGDLESASKAAGEALATFEGFISRDLGQGEDGTFIDVVRWRDMDCAQAAAENAMKSSACGSFFQLIDPESIDMSHFNKV